MLWAFFFFLFFFSLLLLLLFMKISYTSHSLYYKLDVWHRPVADSIRVHDMILDIYVLYIYFVHACVVRSFSVVINSNNYIQTHVCS